MPSMNKLESDRIPGGKRFVANASNTCRLLSTFRDLLYDIVDFAGTASKLIVDMPVSHIVSFDDFENNREMCTLFLDLLKVYVRVFFFFSTIKTEGKAMYCLYAAACRVLQPATAIAGGKGVSSAAGAGAGASASSSSQFTSAGLYTVESSYDENIGIMFDHLDNPKRHFIDRFSSTQPAIRGIILQLRTTIFMADDIDSLSLSGHLDLFNANMAKNPLDFGSGSSYGAAAAASNLKKEAAAAAAAFSLHSVAASQAKAARDSGTADPGSISTYPVVNTPLFAGSALNLYTELQAVSSYRDSVIFAVLACPACLFDAEVLAVLSACIDDILAVNIFRDFNLSIHVELEALSEMYPDPTIDAAVVIPKGLKLKTTLKSSARAAVTQAAALHASRRVSLTNHIEKMFSLLKALPGLLGPKLPAVLALCSLAREEGTYTAL
jgi:hypothetical protein